MVQDNGREIQLVELLGLIHSKNRMGFDATDHYGNEFELKTTTNNSVTTARDLGPRYLERLQRRYLIVARGAYKENEFVVEEVWFLAPFMMESWMKPYTAMWAEDQRLGSKLSTVMGENEFSEQEITKVKVRYERGSTLNNPKISMIYVRKYGVPLEESDKKLQLRRLVAEHPIMGGGTRNAIGERVDSG